MEQETNRQKKIAGLIQRDLADIIQKDLRKVGKSNIIISVTKVRVTADLSLAKAYISIYPKDNADKIMEELQHQCSYLKHQVAQRTRHQLRKMPELELNVDDSIDYIHSIEEAVKGKEDPIQDPDLLDKRKKV